MYELLGNIQVGDWLAISTKDGRCNSILQQVTSITPNCVKTSEYMFKKDGTAFLARYKHLTAYLAKQEQIESTQRKPETEEQRLARYLATVDASRWETLGLPKLKKIVAELEKSQAK